MIKNPDYTGPGLGHLKITPLAIPLGPIDDRTEVFRYSAPDPWNPKTDVEFKVNTYECFNGAGPAGSLPVLKTLKRIHDCIRDDICPALNDFVRLWSRNCTGALF